MLAPSAAVAVPRVLEAVQPPARGRHPCRLRRRDHGRGARFGESRTPASAGPTTALFRSRRGRAPHGGVPRVLRSVQTQLLSAGSDHALLDGGVDEPREHGWFRDVRLIHGARGAEAVGPGGPQPAFFLLAACELASESLRAPLGRRLLRVTEQGGLDPLLLGPQHGLNIGTEPVSASVPDADPLSRARARTGLDRPREYDSAMRPLDATLIAEEDRLWHELHATMDSFTPEQALVAGYYPEGWSAKDAWPTSGPGSRRRESHWSRS